MQYSNRTRAEEVLLKISRTRREDVKKYVRENFGGGGPNRKILMTDSRRTMTVKLDGPKSRRNPNININTAELFHYRFPPINSLRRF